MIARRWIRRSGAEARGFTLIETSLALVIIGVGVIAFVEAHNAFVRNNAWSSQVATATLLANEVRELTRRLPRHDPVTGLFLEDGPQGPVAHGWGLETGESLPEDFDDVDDLDGLTFGAGGDMDGPIDALGNPVPTVNANGEALLDDEGNVIPLEGWSQTVIVQKIDPYDYATVREVVHVDAATGDFAGRDVDEFPLRVTVVVEYQGPYDASPSEVSRVMWIVP